MSDDPSDPELHSCVRWGGYRCQGCVAEGERAATERIVRLVQRFERPMVLLNRHDLITEIQKEHTDD